MGPIGTFLVLQQDSLTLSDFSGTSHARRDLTRRLIRAGHDLGNPVGNRVGTFRVRYTKAALVLSDFKPQ